MARGLGNDIHFLEGPEPGGSFVAIPLQYKMAISWVFDGHHDGMAVWELREKLEREYPRSTEGYANKA